MTPALSDLLSQAHDTGLSWTYSPSGIRRQLRPLLNDKRLRIVKRTFEGDTQVYEFIVLTDAGQQLMKDGR